MDIKTRLTRCCGKPVGGYKCSDGIRCSDCFDKLEGWREIEELQQKLTVADKERKSCTNALMTCRGMLEQALPHLTGTPIEQDFRFYLNIVSSVIGDFSWKQADIVTPEEHGKWLHEQLNKRTVSDGYR